MTEEDCLKLTTYFGERDRVASAHGGGGRLLADELIDALERHRVRMSVLLRGAEGFGRLHHLRTDRLLSLSEDLPVMAVALDRPDRIGSALRSVLEIERRGLVTLERARLLTGPGAAAPRLLEREQAAKLTVYVGRRERIGAVPAYVAVCDLLHRRGLAGATVLLGVDGTRDGERTRAAFFGRNAAVPMMIVAVGDREPISRVLAELGGLLRDPILTLERVHVLKRDGELLARPQALAPTDPDGLGVWRKLTVYTSQAATWAGRPLHLELVRRLRASDAAGATSVKGIWGFHGAHAPHGDRLLQLRRHVPVVTISIDRAPRSDRAFEIIDELTATEGLVTSETVPALTAMSAERTVGGLRLAGPEP